VAESRGKAHATVPTPSTVTSSSQDKNALPPTTYQDGMEIANVSVPRSPSLWQVLVPTSDPEKKVWAQLSMTVWAALFENGAMMGLPCSTCVPSRSVPVGEEIPESLQPTELQLTTIHPRWIDRFPFPRMRDNMITVMSLIDEDEFLRDLFCMTSFTIRPGAAPGDPTAWKIGKEFSTKWGYLFY
jgi:hypothetical protein